MQHQDSICRSFGPQAEAYLTSAVHAKGADLDLLADAVAAMKHPVVLDLGCGAGHASFAVAPVAQEVVAYDLAEPMLQVVAATASKRRLPNIRTQLGSVERLPFDDAQFDCVVSRYSAHHWRDVKQALREIRRVLKPGGRAAFVDVAGGPEPIFDTHLQALELLRDPSHVRDYTVDEWLSMFQSSGFDSEVSRRWRLSLEFSSWVSRIGTSADRVAALRCLWSGAPAEVHAYFNLQEDLSFELDVIMILAQRA